MPVVAGVCITIGTPSVMFAVCNDDVTLLAVMVPFAHALQDEVS